MYDIYKIFTESNILEKLKALYIINKKLEVMNKINVYE